MIISRYLKKEVIATLLAVTLVLLLIFLSDRLVRYLSYAASGKIAASLLFQLMGFEIPYYLALLLPLGLFLGVILVYSRLYTDNELRVMHACGMSVRHLMRITTSLALLIALITALLMFWINPYLASEKAKLLARQTGAVNLINTLVPGSFRVTEQGDKVFYVKTLSRNRKVAENLFVAQQIKPKSDDEGARWMVISAGQGYQEKNRALKGRFIVAENGYRYEGIPGQQDYKITRFDKYALRLPEEVMTSKRQVLEAIPSYNLLRQYNNPQYAAEFQWRFAIPLSTLVLALLAIPLSEVKPRQGRYAILLPAILVYVIYVNLLFVARNLVEQKFISLDLGMWWVHGVMLMLLGFILFFPLTKGRRL